MTMRDEPVETYDIGELAARADVTRRTVRYYVAEGLLPSPGGAGQQRTYTREHLLRLHAIKRLKDAYLPLDEIRRHLDGLDEHALQEILVVESAPLPESAADYIAAVLGGGESGAARRMSGTRVDDTVGRRDLSALASQTPPPVPPPALTPASLPQMVDLPPAASASTAPGAAGPPGAILPAISAFIKERRAVREMSSRGDGQDDAATPASVASQSALDPASLPPATAWQRVALGPGVELHYQETRDERRGAVLSRIIRLARDLLSTLT